MSAIRVIMGEMFNDEDWFLYLDEPMQELVNLGFYLLDREQMAAEGLYDYSFVVFPVAKAYEGFLKKLLWNLQLISKEDWESDRFRIGRSLNPELPMEMRSEGWVHDALKEICGKYRKKGENCAVETFWKGWKEGRNKIFHYFGDRTLALSLDEAKEKLEMMKAAMVLGADYRKRIKG